MRLHLLPMEYFRIVGYTKLWLGRAPSEQRRLAASCILYPAGRHWKCSRPLNERRELTTEDTMKFLSGLDMSPIESMTSGSREIRKDERWRRFSEIRGFLR
jgi:hypothetical protein